MKHFAIPLFSISLFACLLFCLFNYHDDNLAKFVPAGAEAYWHAKPRAWQKMPTQLQLEFLHLVKQNDRTTIESWQKLFQTQPGEWAVFWLNNQIYSLFPNTPANRLLLQQENATFTTFPEALAFPEINIAKNKQKYCSKHFFNDLVVCLHPQDKLLAYLNFPLPTEKIDFSVKLNKSSAKIFLNYLTEITPRPLTPETVVPENSKGFFANIEAKQIPEMLEQPENFAYLLVKRLNKKVNLAINDQDFHIFIANSEVDLENLENTIINTLTRLYPSIEKKFLPDSTISHHLVAKSTAWEIIDSTTQGQKQHFIVPKSEKIFNLAKYTPVIVLETAYGYEIFPQNSILYPNRIFDLENLSALCQIKATTPFVWLNIDSQTNPDEKITFWLTMQKNNKIGVCIY